MMFSQQQDPNALSMLEQMRNRFLDRSEIAKSSLSVEIEKEPTVNDGARLFNSSDIREMTQDTEHFLQKIEDAAYLEVGTKFSPYFELSNDVREEIKRKFDEQIAIEFSKGIIKSNGSEGIFRYNKSLWHRIHKGSESVESHFLNLCTFTDDRMLKLKKYLHSELAKNFPICNKNDSGFTVGGSVVDSFDKVLCLTGIRPSVVGFDSINSKELREKANLPNDWRSARDRTLAKQYVKHLIKNWIPVSIPVNDKSNSGGSDGIYSKEGKILRAINAMANFDKVFNLIDNWDLKGCVDNFGLAPVYLSNFRFMSDRPGKKRKGVTLEGLQNGSLEHAFDIDPKLSGRLSGFASQRVRHVKGLDNALNCIGHAMTRSWIIAVKEIYPYSFGRHGRDDLERQVNELYSKFKELGGAFEVCCYDCVSFDQSVGQFMYDLLDECFLEVGFNPKLVKLWKACREAPILYRNVLGDNEAHIAGDLHSKSKNTRSRTNRGLASGVFSVSSDGKLLCGLDYYITCRHMLAKLGIVDLDDDSEEILEKYFKGDLGIIDMNEGDDHAIFFDSVSKRRCFEEIKDSCGYFAKEAEIGSSLTGFVISEVSSPTDHERRFRVFNSAVTYVTNFLSPERGSESKFNKYLNFGLIERLGIYNKCPEFLQINDIIRRGFKLFFDIEDIFIYISHYAEKDRIALSELQSNESVIDSATLEVLLDPDKLKWKYAPEEINMDIINKFVNIIPIRWPFYIHYVFDIENNDLQDINFYKVEEFFR